MDTQQSAQKLDQISKPSHFQRNESDISVEDFDVMLIST